MDRELDGRRRSGPTAPKSVPFTWDTYCCTASHRRRRVLLAPWTARRLNVPRLWHVGYAGAYALAAADLGRDCCSRGGRAFHLGRLWSGSITRKEGHRVVDTGPYALVRHPIYTGLIFALLATAIAQATVTGTRGRAC